MPAGGTVADALRHTVDLARRVERGFHRRASGSSTTAAFPEVGIY
ncbi:hypothetical protein [Micromonospora sp. WMMD708]